VRAIGNHLDMDYSAIRQTTHLAARMEQMAKPGTVLITASRGPGGGLRPARAVG
jgi:class 3 adenylate cyclase